MNSLEQSLKERVDGDIFFDSIHKSVYSVDASIFEVEPIGIVIPRTSEAFIHTIRVAKEFNIPIIPRGAATGITGGCLGKGLIIDMSKYLNHILEINYEKEYAICEPGVIQDQLNTALAKHGYRLGPDTSTGNRATIGGMLANNAAGARSLLFGTMADHVLEVELVLADGEVLILKEMSNDEWMQKCLLQNQEGHIYRTLEKIKAEYKDDIEKRFPHIPRRVSGYNLDALLNETTFNPCRLIAGSEGSLGVATKIKVRICQKPKEIGLGIVFFDDMHIAMQSIAEMLKHQPIALEMIDDKIVEMAKQAPSMKHKIDWIQGNPKTIFVAEFAGNSKEDLHQKMNAYSDEMQRKSIGYAQISIEHPEKISDVWDVRKSGLGLLLSKRSYSRAIGFIEDVTVAPSQLPDFMKEFLAYLNSKGKSAGVYGHVGSGCMHIRPYIDLRSKDDLILMKQMMLDVSDLLLKHQGALSGEHGDGLIRSWLNKKMFGDRLYEAFTQLKQAFDPENRMNPGKIVQHFPELQDLRISPNTKNQSIKTFLDFSPEGGFDLAVDLCNGNGLCRKSEKVMCPSFQATQDEFHSTRARAQALRSLIHSRIPFKDLTSQGMHDVMDLCLQCKGCQTECPSEIDMAKMKSEFLYHYQKEHGTPFRSSLFANIGFFNKVGSYFPSFFNFFAKTSFFQLLLKKIGITTEHPFPLITDETFTRWFNKRPKKQSTQSVVLFNDTFTEFNHPHIGKAAVKVLENLGYTVLIPQWKCCGRPAMSKGILPKAKQMAEEVIDLLYPFAEKGLAVIGIEPSCILTLTDDYIGLLGHDHKKLNRVIQYCQTFDEFLEKQLVNGSLPLSFDSNPLTLLIHGHCHQKALVGMQPTLKVLHSLPGVTVTEIKSGCCGMAGSFGYEEEHYAISQKIGSLHLFPAINSNPTCMVIANGISCRSQIAHGTGRDSYHLAEVIANRIKAD